MKKIYFTIIGICLSAFCISQNIDDMNKKELRSALLECQIKKDSILSISTNLIIEKSKNEIAITDLEIQIKNSEKKEAESIKLYNQLVEKNQELSNEILSANNYNSILKDSISNLMKLLKGSDLNKLDSGEYKDFLNSYFINPFPLNNNKFKFKLEKIILGEGQNEENRFGYGFAISGDKDYSYKTNENIKFHQFLPEIINSNSITLYGVKKGVDMEHINSAKDVLYSLDLNKIYEHLPKIEILKNKLVTFSYPNGTQENFLLNVKNGEENNHRKTLQIELASEDVKTDGTKNTESDIIWKIYRFENESYLALTYLQMQRLWFEVNDINKEIEIKDHNNEQIYLSDNYKVTGESTTGRGHYIFRNKDSFMDSGDFLLPNNVVFLFKLIEN